MSVFLPTGHSQRDGANASPGGPQKALQLLKYHASAMQGVTPARQTRRVAGEGFDYDKGRSRFYDGEPLRHGCSRSCLALVNATPDGEADEDGKRDQWHGEIELNTQVE